MADRMTASHEVTTEVTAERLAMSNPPAAAGFGARSAGLRMARAELLRGCSYRSNKSLTILYFAYIMKYVNIMN